MKRILLLEPDAVLARTYQAALKSARYKVAHARDAQGAVHAIDKKRPDAVIMEVQLGAHNGVEFLHELRSYGDWAGIPVVILSQLPPREIGLPAAVREKLGIIACLYKPRTTLQTLVSTMAGALS